MTRRDKVDQAITAIREFYRLGQKVPAKGVHGENYGQGIIKNVASQTGVNEDTVRKARAFADKQTGYSPKEMNELCKLIERVQSDLDEKSRVFGRTHVIRILSVPKKQRKSLQEQAVKKSWSVSRLQAEIAKRYGTRRDGGRRRQLPGTLDELLTQCEKMCEGWRRWYDELAEPSDDTESGHIAKDDLPEELWSMIKVARGAIRRLQELVVQHLRTMHPDFGVRQAFRDDEAATNGSGRGRKR